MKNKFMIALKNPPTTMIIDSLPENYNDSFSPVEFRQDGMKLLIYLSVDSNIAFIKEVTPEEVAEMQKDRERIIQQMRGEGGRIVTPKIPGRPN